MTTLKYDAKFLWPSGISHTDYVANLASHRDINSKIAGSIPAIIIPGLPGWVAVFVRLGIKLLIHVVLNVIILFIFQTDYFSV